MRTLRLLLAVAVLVGLLGPAAVLAQQTVPNQGTYFPQPGNRKFEGNVWVTGGLYIGATQTDWTEWFPAYGACAGYESGGTYLTPVKVATYDWGLRGAASKTWDVVCSLNLPTQTTTGAGAKVTSIDISYGITGANATSSAFTGVRSVTYASGALNAIATFGGTITAGTMQTVSQVTPYLTSATFGTPAYVQAAKQSLVVEFQVVTASSCLLTLYGISVNYTRGY